MKRLGPPISRFVAVDVETASKTAGSICQVGLIIFEHDRPVSALSVMVRPACRFHPRATQLHGMDTDTVRRASTWREVYPAIAGELQGRVIVSHTGFDRRAIFAACCRARWAMFSYRSWVDSRAVARDAWPGLPTYSLRSLADRLSIAYTPHVAVEDARAAGEVFIHAQRELHLL